MMMLKKKIEAVWWKDRQAILKLLISEQRRTVASLPNVDGLYGGKKCVRQFRDQKTMTSRKDNDPKFDKKKHYNRDVFEKIETINECELELCLIKYVKEGDTAPVNDNCEIYQWGEWGEFGKCDLSCGDKGKRKRKRDCENTCLEKDKQKSPDDKCRPHFNNIVNKTYTNEDHTECTPCPQEEIASWTEWGLWTGKGFQCGSGKAKQVRKRKCLPGKSGQKDCPGKAEQLREFVRPSCEGEVDMEGEKPKRYNGGESANMDKDDGNNKDNIGGGGSETGYSEDDEGNDDNNDNKENEEKDGENANTENENKEEEANEEGKNNDGEANEEDENNKEGEDNADGTKEDGEANKEEENNKEGDGNEEGNTKEDEEGENEGENEKKDKDNEGGVNKGEENNEGNDGNDDSEGGNNNEGDGEPKEGYNEGDNNDGNNDEEEEKNNENEGGDDASPSPKYAEDEDK